MKQETVLVVDDEALIRCYVCDVIEAAGHQTKEAGNADEAMQMLADDTFTMVLTDINMPGRMDGLALARCVRNTWL